MNQIKKFGKKIINFILTHYISALIAIGALIILGIIIMITNGVKKEINELKVENASLYQFQGTEKFDYETTITINQNENSTTMQIDGETVTLDSTPFYFKGEKKVLFPKEMSVVFPLSNIAQKKINHFSYIDGTGLNYYIQNQSLDYLVENVFLYDGNDLYFFLTDVTLKVNEEEIHLPAFSYVILNYNNELYAFDYENTTMTYIENVETDVTATNESYQINLSIDAVVYGEKSRLLMKEFNYLSTLK